MGTPRERGGGVLLSALAWLAIACAPAKPTPLPVDAPAPAPKASTPAPEPVVATAQPTSTVTLPIYEADAALPKPPPKPPAPPPKAPTKPPAPAPKVATPTKSAALAKPPAAPPKAPPKPQAAPPKAPTKPQAAPPKAPTKPQAAPPKAPTKPQAKPPKAPTKPPPPPPKNATPPAKTAAVAKPPAPTPAKPAAAPQPASSSKTAAAAAEPEKKQEGANALLRPSTESMFFTMGAGVTVFDLNGQRQVGPSFTLQNRLRARVSFDMGYHFSGDGSGVAIGGVIESAADDKFYDFNVAAKFWYDIQISDLGIYVGPQAKFGYALGVCYEPLDCNQFDRVSHAIAVAFGLEGKLVFEDSYIFYLRAGQIDVYLGSFFAESAIVSYSALVGGGWTF